MALEVHGLMPFCMIEQQNIDIDTYILYSVDIDIEQCIVCMYCIIVCEPPHDRFFSPDHSSTALIGPLGGAPRNRQTIKKSSQTFQRQSLVRFFLFPLPPLPLLPLLLPLATTTTINKWQLDYAGSPSTTTFYFDDIVA